MCLSVINSFFYIGLIFSTSLENNVFMELNASNCEEFIAKMEHAALLLETRVKSNMLQDDRDLKANLNLCNRALGRFLHRIINLKEVGTDDDFYVNIEVYKRFLQKLKIIYNRIRKINVNPYHLAYETLKSTVLSFQAFIYNVIIQANPFLNTDNSTSTIDTTYSHQQNQSTTVVFENPQANQAPILTYPQGFSQIHYTQIYETFQSNMVPTSMNCYQPRTQLQNITFCSEFTQHPHSLRLNRFSSTSFLNPRFSIRTRFNGERIGLNVATPVFRPHSHLVGFHETSNLVNDFNRMPVLSNNWPVLQNYVPLPNNAVERFRPRTPFNTDGLNIHSALQEQRQLLYQHRLPVSLNNNIGSSTSRNN